MKALALLPCFLLACVEPMPEPPIDNGWCSVFVEPRRAIVSATCPNGETRVLELHILGSDSEIAASGVTFSCGSVKLTTSVPDGTVHIGASLRRADGSRTSCE